MLTFVVAYYLYLKQKVLLNEMHEINFGCTRHYSTNHCLLFNRLCKINNKLVQFYEEVYEYSPFMRRTLSIYFMCSMIVVSCCTFMLLMTDSAIQFKILFFLIDTMHIVFLSVVIYFCSKMPTGQHSMSMQYYTFITSIIRKQYKNIFCLIKVIHLYCCINYN